MTDDPIFEVDQHITAPSRYYAGKLGSRFFVALRDEQKILGSRCQNCNVVYYPPRSTCGRCFGQISEDDLLEIGPQGTLETFTQIHYHEPVHPPYRNGGEERPLIYGVIKLDGADTGMAHLIAEADFSTLKVGMRMQAVFADEPQANILAIRYFKPVQE